jgi:hypothetical protein
MRTLVTTLASLALLCPALAYADPVQDAVEDYALYQNDVSTLLDLDIDNARSVDAALARISRHDPENVSRGWIAYGALTAAQSPQFVASVERSVRSDGRAAVLQRLRDDPTYARRLTGSAQAIDLIFTAASADAARTAVAGARYDEFARQLPPRVQLVSSTFHVDLGGSTRLSAPMLERLHVSALAGRPASDANAFGGVRFWDSLAGRDGRTPRGHTGSEIREYASVTDHMLTLAALVAASASSDRHQVADLLDEPLTENCLHMQRLQLRQCLSVSVDGGERAYCLGHHALAGPGACFSAMQR